MRSDFLGRCITYPNLNKYISDHLIQIEPMNRTALARAIEMPARLGGLALESGLLEHMLNDVTGAANELPLLEHALLELYERRRGGLLTRSAYDEIGGIEGALAKRAEGEYLALDHARRELLRKMFVLCLIHPGEGAEDTRRRATRDELESIGGTGASNTVRELIERWTHARLLTGTRDEARGKEMIDVAHEALIRRWVRIGEWMIEGRETAQLLNRLRQNARTWQDAGRDDDHLLRGGPLYQMQELVEREAGHLGALEKAFVAAGLKGLRRERFQRRMVTALGFLLAAFAFFMFFRANHQKNLAEWEKARAEQKTLDGNFSLATMFTEKAGIALKERQSHKAWLLSLAALAQEIPAEKDLPGATGRFAHPVMYHAERLLWTSPVNHGGNRTAFSYDGSLMALSGNDHQIRLISLETGGPAGILTGHSSNIRSLAFRPDTSGRDELLASAGEDAKVYLWRIPRDAWQWEKPVRVLEHRETVLDLAFSSDGRRLATATQGGTVRVWTMPRGRLPEREPVVLRSGTGLAVTSLAYSPEGRLVIGEADGQVTVFEDGHSKELESNRDEGEVVEAAFLGERPVALVREGNVTVWSEKGDIEARIKRTESGGVTALAVDGMNRQLLTLAEDGRVMSWDGTTWEQLKEHRGKAERSQPIPGSASEMADQSGIQSIKKPVGNHRRRMDAP